MVRRGKGPLTNVLGCPRLSDCLNVESQRLIFVPLRDRLQWQIFELNSEKLSGQVFAARNATIYATIYGFWACFLMPLRGAS